MNPIFITAIILFSVIPLQYSAAQYCCEPPGSLPPSSPPSVTLEPSLVSQGDSVTVTGSNFDSYNNIAISLNGKQVASAKADSSGSFSVAFTVSIAAGAYKLHATDDAGKNAEAKFEVKSTTPSAPPSVPEFGTIATLVLAIAISSIIVISRSKIQKLF